MGSAIYLLTLTAMASGAASAQTAPGTHTPSSIVEGLAQVPPGDEVIVIDSAGSPTRGRLTAATHDAIHLTAAGRVRRVPASTVREIQWRRPDSWLDGALIGAAVGAAPGLYWLIVDPNECAGMCPEDYALVAVGAVVGALIDRAIQKPVTVYAAAPRTPPAVSVAPLVRKGRAGLQVALTF